jgi:uncharacterized membrane protein
MATRRNAAGWYHPASITRAFISRPKILVAIAIGVVGYFILPQSLPASARTTLAWDAGALTYLVAAFWIMTGEGAAEIRKRAAEHDENALVIPIIVVAAIAASFLAVAGVLTVAKNADGSDLKPLYLLLAGSTIVLSWFVMQTVFTIHYAHEFYAPRHGGDKSEACFGFAGDEKPDYWDFLYFSSTIGATSQTSDTEVSSSKMRRLVTAHSIISFFFNTIVLALMINIAASLI